MPGLVELAEITRAGRRKVSRAELADAIIQEYGGDACAALVGLIKIYLPLMTELREVTGQRGAASDDAAVERDRRPTVCQKHRP